MGVAVGLLVAVVDAPVGSPPTYSWQTWSSDYKLVAWYNYPETKILAILYVKSNSFCN